MEVRDWIDFMELSPGDLQSLADAWALVSPRMPQILDGFYKCRIVSGQKWRMKGLSLERLKASQFSYWEVLFSGVLDERYRGRVRLVASRHFQAGVTMADYIASYGWFLNAFEREIAALEPCGKRRAALMASVRRAVFLDMTFAVSACHVAYVD
ncbi:hypothetical protein GCM10007285_21520 [Stappia taiwanensis]|nr:hypothetical protein GCM10007285_21520 [Stappia taiwanensis]